MKILLTGGSGQIGEALLADLQSFLPDVSSDIDLTLLMHNNPVSLFNPHRSSILINFINQVEGHYDVAIHLAAIISTPFCQKPENRELVLKTNVGLTRNICDHADFTILVSTDNVFKGNERRELSETDVPDPCNFYGMSKLEAEKVVVDGGGAVVRIQTMFGCRNLITTAAINTVRGKPHSPFWNDTYSRPSFLPDLAKTLKVLLARRVSGLYHCSTIGGMFSRADIAKRVLDFFREHDLPHQIDAISEEPCSVPLFPRHLVLNSEATRCNLGVEFTLTNEALDRHLVSILIPGSQTEVRP